MTKQQKKISTTKSIVIIGAQGFKGQNLLKHLEINSQYKKVVVIDSKKPCVTLKKTKFYKLDLTETLADVTLTDILKKEKCDTLIHSAIPTTPPHNESHSHEFVAIGSYYIFNACAAANVRKVILASTADIYGAFPSNPNYLTEKMSLRGHLHSQFLADKIDAEKQALKYQKKYPNRIVTILRTCTTLGPTINSYKTRYFQRPVVTTMLGFDPLLQFVHEEDVINALLTFINKDHKGIFNLAGDGVLPLSRVIELCGKTNLKLTQIGFKSLVQILWMLDLSPAPASHVNFLRYLCIADNQKIKNDAGFTPQYTTKEALMSFVSAERLRELNLKEV
ncbi:MAG: NAD-dependent epimerase/dehydratase family protein [bacterium]|nr:NAD-dependent epimerase/dehydratase family protein [bacterium]